jgi:hypothetical protein
MEDVNKAAQSMNNIPFSTLLGGPVEACIDAQKAASDSSLEFIREVGMEQTSDRVVTVSFSFYLEGKPVKIVLPLLAIVPIPYFSVDTLDIEFNASVTDYGNKEDIRSFCGRYDRPPVSINTTGKSSFSYNANLNIKLHASKDNMPSGLGRLLNIFERSIRTQVISFYLSEKKLDLYCGDSHTFTAVVNGETVDNTTLKWTCDVPDIVVIDNGKIIAQKEGTVTVAAESSSFLTKAVCVVIVKERVIHIEAAPFPPGEETTIPLQPVQPVRPVRPLRPFDPNSVVLPPLAKDPDDMSILQAGKGYLLLNVLHSILKKKLRPDLRFPPRRSSFKDVRRGIRSGLRPFNSHPTSSDSDKKES